MNHTCANCGCPLGYDGLCWRCRIQQEHNLVLAWTDEEIAQKLAHLIANAQKLDDWQSAQYKDAHHLLTVRGICPPEMQIAAASANVTYFEHLYYHAPAEARDILIQRLLATEDAHEASKLMNCLAMQGDDTSLAVLFSLEQHPRSWRQELYVDPSIYAQCGGWTFDETGRRLVLNFDTCYPLVKGDPVTDTTVQVGRLRQDICSHCGCTMVDMLILNCQDERLHFLGCHGIITATCCPNCVSLTEASFSRYTLDGGSVPLPTELFLEDVENYLDEGDMQSLATNCYVLASTPSPIFYGVSNEDINTIGGFANWVQDWQYTTCPDCNQPMKYVAQLQWDTLINYSEGTLYIEICPQCQIASMHHQQT